MSIIMASKATFSILMVLLVVSAKGHTLNNALDDLMKQLETVANKALESSQKLLNDAEQTLIKLAQSKLTSAESDMEDTEENLTNKLAVIKQNATKNNLTIDDCLGENQSNLNNLTTNFAEDLGLCINTTVNVGLTYVQKSLNDIKGMVGEVSSFKKDMKACGFNFICLSELTVRVSAEIVSLPMKITANSAAAVSQISVLSLQVDSCATEKTDTWTTKGDALLDTIKKCVSEAQKTNSALDNLLDKLKIAADKSLKTSQKMLDDAKQTLVKLANSTLSSAESDMDETEETLTDKLAAIKQNATENNLIINDCLGENETNLTNLSSDFDADLDECINNIINEGLTYVQKSQDDMEGLVDEVSSFREDRKACKGALICLTQLTTKVTAAIASLPVEIGANSAAAVSQISLLSQQVDSCSTEKTNTWTTKGNDLLDTITECVSEAQKLNSALDDLMNQLQKAYDESAETAQKTLNDAQQTLVESTNSTLSSAESDMDKTEETLTAELAAIKQNATENNIIIDECLGENETNLTNLSTDFAADLDECRNTTINEGSTYVRKSLDDITGMVGEVSAFGDDRKACEGAFTCLTKLTDNVTAGIASLPVKIEANSAAAVSQINLLSQQVDTCVTEKTDTWTTKGDDILDTIRECASEAQKLNSALDEVMDQLQKAYDESLETSEKTLNDAQQTLVESVNSTLSSAESDMDKTKETLIAELAAIKQNATENNIIIDECLGENETNLTNLSTDFAADLVECSNTTTDEGLTYVQKSLDDIKGMVDEVSGFGDDRKACEGAFVCLTNLTDKVTAKIASLPVKIEGNSAAAVSQINLLSQQVDTCVTEKTDTWTTKGNALLDTIEECVTEAQKLNSALDDVMDQLQKVYNESLKTSEKTLNDAQQTLVESINSTLISAESDMDKTEETLTDKLAAIKQNATENNIIIDECLGENETNLTNLSTDFAADLDGCSNTTIDEGLAYVKKSLDDITGMAGEVSAFGEDRKTCKGAFTCLTKLTDNVTAEIASLPVKIEANSAAAVSQINLLSEPVDTCVTEKTDTWTTKGNTLLDTISECVSEAQKLNSALDDVMDQLQKAYDESLETSQKTLNDAQQTLVESVNSTLSSAESDMEKTEETLTDKLAVIKQNATENNVTIDECLGENEINLTNLSTAFAADLDGCSNTTIDEGSAYVQKSLDDIQSMVDEISAFKEDREACKGAFTCLTKLTDNVTADIASLPVKMEENSAAAVSQINLLSQQVDTCVTEKTDTWTTKGNDLLDTITECVSEAQKLNSELDDLMDQLQTVYDETLETSQKQLNDAQQTLVESVNSTLSSAESEMEKTEETLTDKLAVIKQNATENNVTIDECLGENETNLTNLSTDFAADLDGCSNTTINEGLAYVQKSLDDMKDMKAEISAFREDREACKGAFTCLTKLSDNVTAGIASLPVRMEDNSAAAVSEIGLLSQQVDSCATEKNDTWTTKGNALLDTITECVSKAQELNSKLNDLMDQLQVVADESSETSQKKLSDAQQTLVESANSTVSSAESDMDKTEESLIAELDAIKQNATEKNVTIDDCLGENETNLTNLSSGFAADLGLCMNNTINEGSTYVQKSLDNITVMVGEVSGLKEDITACEGASICLTELSANITAEIESLPVRIGANSDAAVAEITPLSLEVERCATDNNATWTDKGNALLATIKECVLKISN